MSSTERLAAAPNVPTLREQGIDFVRFGWLGICAAAGTPPHVIDRLRKHIATIVASPDYREVTERAGSIPAASSPEELRSDHPADPRRRRSDDPGVRAAAGAVSADDTRRARAAAAPIEKSPAVCFNPRASPGPTGSKRA